MHRILGVVAAALALLVIVPMADAAQQRSDAPSQWQTSADAQWKPHQGFESQHGLVTFSDAGILTGSDKSYGELDMLNPPATIDDVNSASYDFNADQTGPSGGSPRLVFLFTDKSGTSQAYLRPTDWTQDTWTHMDANTGNNWDSIGGSCAFQFNATFAQVKACHSGEPITAVFAINDSGWLYPAGETVVLDNVEVNGATATGPGNSK
ncbi:MAG: hypothetical protein ACJ77M_05645 [Thermoleophilaceae bacterium]|jgi:hypothetical protein